MYTWETSLNPATSLRISVFGKTLIIQHLPDKLCKREMILVVKNDNGEEIMRNSYSRTANKSLNLDKLNIGSYYFDVYYLMGDLYWPFFSHNQPMLVKDYNRIWFAASPFTIYNSIQTHSWETDCEFLKRQLVSNRQYQSNEREIVQRAKEITQGHFFPYTKMLAIHDYIANNVAYDTDAFYSNQYLYNDNSALTTLRTGRGVCQGYTNLSIALLRSIGIPAMEVPCFALGREYSGGWKKTNNIHSSKANHVITAAFVNNRWSVMDITWDSDYEIVNGKRCEKTGCGLSHKYFDMTTTMFSLTHKLIR